MDSLAVRVAVVVDGVLQVREPEPLQHCIPEERDTLAVTEMHL
jgi:hypothetical protein